MLDSATAECSAVDHEAVTKLEEDLQRIFEDAFARKTDRFSAGGLAVRVDPLARVGDGDKYSSFVEATVLGADGVPCDVAFAHIVSNGKVVIDAETFQSWVEQITDNLIEENAATPGA